MMKKIGLLALLLAFGVSCSKKKNKDFQISLKKGVSSSAGQNGSGETDTQFTETADEDENMVNEEDLAQKEAEERFGVIKINEAIDKLLANIAEEVKAMGEDDTPITLEDARIQDYLKQTDRVLTDIMLSRIDEDSQSVVLIREEIEAGKVNYNSGLNEMSDTEGFSLRVYVRNFNMLGKSFSYVIGFKDLESQLADDTENVDEDEDTDEDTEEDMTTEEQGE